jgi:hypothetical protein
MNYQICDIEVYSSVKKLRYTHIFCVGDIELGHSLMVLSLTKNLNQNNNQSVDNNDHNRHRDRNNTISDVV